MHSRFLELFDPVINHRSKSDLADYVLLDLDKHYDDEMASFLRHLSIAEATIDTSSSFTFVEYDEISGWGDGHLKEDGDVMNMEDMALEDEPMTPSITPDTLSSSENDASAQDFDMSDSMSLCSDASCMAVQNFSDDIPNDNGNNHLTNTHEPAEVATQAATETTRWVTSIANLFSYTTPLHWHPDLPHDQCNLEVKPELFAALSLHGGNTTAMEASRIPDATGTATPGYYSMTGTGDGYEGYSYAGMSWAHRAM